MKRILFVDDEPHVLAGLRRMLHRQRRDWEMTFAESGAGALDALAASTFDVIVTDMRMPGMDGAELLSRVHAAHPAVVRIVLSGYTELEAAMRAVPVAHQFLTKPCSAEKLKGVVERSCQIQGLMGNPAVLSVVGELEGLPSLPETYAALTRALADPEVEISEISAIVEQDPAMCAKILQLVNSAFFGLPQSLSSIDQAVGYLGTNMIRNLVMAVEVFSPPPDLDAVSHAFLSQIQRHSTVVANLTRSLMDDRQLADDAFMAGMLHDLGTLILAAQLPQEFAESLRRSEQTDRPLFVVEEELIGVSHAEVGAYLLGLWGLPYSVIEAVAYHHRPSRLEHPEFDALTAVHAADALVEAQSPSDHVGKGPRAELDRPYLDAVGVSDKLPQWENQVSAYLEGAEAA